MSEGFNARLGLQRGPDALSVQLQAGDEHLVAPGTVHFAVLATLAEVSAAAAVEAGVVPASVQIQLLRRAAPGLLVARGRLLKSGRRLATAEGEVFQDRRLVAKATVTFALL
jgi:acyl-coenzyme A thioesterase PaaI-like protein